MFLSEVLPGIRCVLGRSRKQEQEPMFLSSRAGPEFQALYEDWLRLVCGCSPSSWDPCPHLPGLGAGGRVWAENRAPRCQECLSWGNNTLAFEMTLEVRLHAPTRSGLARWHKLCPACSWVATPATVETPGVSLAPEPGFSSWPASEHCWSQHPGF